MENQYLIFHAQGSNLRLSGEQIYFSTGILHLPVVEVEGLGNFDVKLNLVPGSSPLLFALDWSSVQ